MPRRTPLEVFINGQTDRQAQYEKRRRDAGFTKTCVWLPTECVDEWKEKARALVAEREAKRASEGDPDPR